MRCFSKDIPFENDAILQPTTTATYPCFFMERRCLVSMIGMAYAAHKTWIKMNDLSIMKKDILLVLLCKYHLCSFLYKLISPTDPILLH